MKDGARVTVVMPAYNAARTLEATYRGLAMDVVDEVILVDDVSHDETVDIAERLGLKVVVHLQNRGYGGNQKTCYLEALRGGADVVVMVHPDNQYDSTLVPEMIQPILDGQADIVLGSRLLSGTALAGGMPWWKFISNRFLTVVENGVFGLSLSEYHTGFRAYGRTLLETVPFLLNSDDFVFDQEIMAQAVCFGFRLGEIPVPTRYFPEASSVNFRRSVEYGLDVLWLSLRFALHRAHVVRSRQFTARLSDVLGAAAPRGDPAERALTDQGRRASALNVPAADDVQRAAIGSNPRGEWDDRGAANARASDGVKRAAFAANASASDDVGRAAIGSNPWGFG